MIKTIFKREFTGYEEEKRNRWRTIAAPDRRTGLVTIHQDVRITGTLLEPGEKLQHRIKRHRHGWLHVATGAVEVNGTRLTVGDAIATSRPTELHLTGHDTADILLFDLA